MKRLPPMLLVLGLSAAWAQNSGTIPWLDIAQDSSSCCHYGVKAFRCFAELFGIGSLDQLTHSLFAQRFIRLVAVQQVDHDLPECQDLRKDYLGLRCLRGTSRGIEQHLAAPLTR